MGLASYLTTKGVPVDPSMIQLSVSAGSLIVVASIATAAAASAASITTPEAQSALSDSLVTALQAITVSEASSALGVTAVSIEPARVSVVVLPAPSPPLPPLSSASFCAAYQLTCVAPAHSAAYENCTYDFAALAAGTTGDVSGDSAACRMYHLNAAVSDRASVHCPHASAQGGLTCVSKLEIASDITLSWAMVSQNIKAFLAVEYQGVGWVGIGVSPAGDYIGSIRK